MTRSTLLQLLAHPTALSGADVRELEQLAKAFPYCQTAHLLLAKAAHDQGSMLAGQRLRRAATYAADRALLRQLIELPAPATPVLATDDLAAAPPTALVTANAALQVAEHLDVEPTALPAEAEAVLAEVAVAVEPVAAPLPEPAQPEAELPEPEAPATETPLPEAELPAQAPLIRPPAEAETARLEFGLADEEPAEIAAYQLPELLELEEVAEPTATALATVAALPAFDGAADVGYVPGEGSRLGFCLQSPAAEAYSLTTGPAALLPSTQLPPTGEFFAPDALLLAHLAAHQALATPALAAPVANDLINSFLRRSPQASSRRRPLPPPDAETEAQPDLAGPSTLAVPDLASESLAKILARQGKTDRAIAIYERLMVKQPEKIAYFAAQIDSLRPPA